MTVNISGDIPSLPGVLSADQVRRTAASIARAQEPSGAIPWYRGGRIDTWDHVECAMALLVGGEVEAAERAYTWLFETQRRDGSWPMRITAGRVEDAGADTNMVAYVAVGVWHHWLVRRDQAFVRRAWPVVRRALDRVVDLQLPFGGIAWGVGELGVVDETALVTGSSSIFQALACGVALGELLDEPQPEWELAAGRLGHALREHEDRFVPKPRYSMDWYYPILGGAVRGAEAEERVASRWDEFVVDGLGIRCVADRPWVTGAETCELVMALDALGEHDRACEQLAAMQHLRDPDGAYWTGYVFTDDARWPVECSTWTAAAVILAVDTLSGTTPGAAIFRGSSLTTDFTEIGLECGCVPADARGERVT
ncbi:MAG: prenyltransferase [Actinomycetota bacterium]